ncbi:hypothetical protein NVIE_2060 [Nitrososphaera viennensis EN76]|uniref:Uncharacterized protein n=1 Tax=Nitrososphaera viennensis EN76 TaxID=926571 RepID=A0A060HSY1_9ARCH|nr:hypothetical protein NVIE_2060 [Nitrososphaera viennensis EN76]
MLGVPVEGTVLKSYSFIRSVVICYLHIPNLGYYLALFS